MGYLRMISLVTITAIVLGLVSSPAWGETLTSTANAGLDKIDATDISLLKAERVERSPKVPLSPEVANRPRIETNVESSMVIPDGFMLVEGDMIVPENYYEHDEQRGVYQTNFWPGGCDTVRIRW